MYRDSILQVDLVTSLTKLNGIRGYRFQRLDGIIPSAQRTQAMEHFNRSDR